MNRTIVSIDTGLAGGISTFQNLKDTFTTQDYKLVFCENTPVRKTEIKKAKTKLDLLNGKKQFIKSGPNKGQAKTIQVEPAKLTTDLDLHTIKDKLTFIVPSKVTVVIEQPGLTQGNAAKATATTFKNFGKLLACAELAGCEIYVVPANQWKKDLGLTKDKLQCVEFAEKLFNKSFRTDRGALLDGQAESALIGYWYINHKLKEENEI